jgi:hypothetical protein
MLAAPRRLETISTSQPTIVDPVRCSEFPLVNKPCHQSRKRTFPCLAKEEILQHKLDMEDLDREYDPVAQDRTEIERKLQSGEDFLVLEGELNTSGRGSHCRARFCIYEKEQGLRGIHAGYTLNVSDNAAWLFRRGEKPIFSL